MSSGVLRQFFFLIMEKNFLDIDSPCMYIMFILYRVHKRFTGYSLTCCRMLSKDHQRLPKVYQDFLNLSVDFHISNFTAL